MNGVRWGALAVVLVAVILAFAFAARFGTDPSLVASPLIGQGAPNLTLPYLEQPGSLDLGGLRGEVVVVNFWASWCLECRLEHPALVTVADRYQASAVRMVGVVFNNRPEDAVAMLDELGRGYAYVTDPGSRAAIEFGVFGVPETFFIDREGVIVAKVTGPTSEELLSATLDQILLGRRPGARTTGTVQSDPDQ
jgi:cytochrome c biogenesis protein CcmG/thiol:disulfide interchange protein DsbE